MHWIYISPHLDDAIYSCGGMIWQQQLAGDRVEIWTICAGDPPDAPFSDFVTAIHKRWGTGAASMFARRLEDENACTIISANHRHFDIPDCIYRRLPESGEPVIQYEEDLWQPTLPQEFGLRDKIANMLYEKLPADANLVGPFGMGGHMDHHLVRTALEQLNHKIFYYADYPYAAENPDDIDNWVGADWKAYTLEISKDGLQFWQKAVGAYLSQISTFWGSQQEMNAAIESYWQMDGGSIIWSPDLPL